METSKADRVIAQGRAIVEAVPPWVAEKILSASEHIGDDRAAVWMSED